MLKRFLKRLLPSHIYSSVLQRARRQLKPVRWGNLRRLSPISPLFGTDRGQPIDRYYIESFLQKHSTDVRGSVLEIGDPAYTLKYGGDRVTHSHVLHVAADNPKATLVGDLQTGQGVPDNAYDCMILTQTLLFIYDIHAAIDNCYKALRPDGVLLATIPQHTASREVGLRRRRKDTISSLAGTTLTALQLPTQARLKHINPKRVDPIFAG